MKLKIQPFERFCNELTTWWYVDRWWSKDEQIKLGIEKQDEF